ncbi:hypothetical protein GE300_17800 [Rhodobacteraceae bacterium 2CG4]|uniref:Sulfotransferase family protein n=1 Tax=Halovulum marinum TaxID=2662447 RepID=A0A6L5Z4T3_9RHOB|nr:hypothetical protein [Halovulum marinum]MSU91437.1 hypothetical protein [Halovulum marinum]
MLLNIDGRFAYLAMTKTGSTSVENAIRRHCHVMFTRHHRATHMPAHHFERFLRPWLDESGIADIDTVCQLRHPVDWLESWWRYRTRPGDWEPEVSTDGIDFARFAEEFVAGEDRPYLRLHRPQSFLCDAGGRLLVDIVFRFEDMDLFSGFLSDRLGRAVKIERHNASPRRRARLSRPLRARLEAHFAPELEIWESGTARSATLPGRAGRRASA